MLKKTVLLLLNSAFLGSTSLFAQTLTKEATNAFALYNKTGDIKQLELARKKVDEGYKTYKDSITYKNNLLRSLVYSTLAYVDSNRKYSYPTDPINVAMFSFKKLNDRKLNIEHQEEITYIKKRLSQAYLSQARHALSYNNYPEAVNSFLHIDSLSSKNITIYHDLAILYERMGYNYKAIEFYQKVLQDRSRPEYYLALSNLYESVRQYQKAVEITQQGRANFPDNKDLVFKELNYFSDAGNFQEVTKLIKNALRLDENNINLNYLAGFSYEMTGKTQQAEEYYKKVLSLDPNNYDANYALGLLYLNLYIQESKSDLINRAKQYLTKANEIDPNQIKTLQSLAILYRNTGEEIQLQRVNNKINQLKLN